MSKYPKTKWVAVERNTALDFHSLRDRFWGKPLDIRPIPIPQGFTQAALEADEADHINVKGPVDAEADEFVEVDGSTILESSQRVDMGSDLFIAKETAGKFLLRGEYKEMYIRVENAALIVPDHGVLVTGQSGIGKSYFLYYVLLKRLEKKLPTVYSTLHGIYLFHGSGLYQLPSDIRVVDNWDPLTPGKDNVWALIDGKTKTTPPEALILKEGPFFPLQAASPNPALFDVWVKERAAMIMIMDPWLWPEVLAGAILQKPLQRKLATNAANVYADLSEKYQRFGSSVRALFTESVEDLTVLVEQALANITAKEFRELHSLAASSVQIDLNRSNRLMVVERKTKAIPGVGRLDSYTVRMVSYSVYKMTLEQISTQSVTDLQSLHDTFDRVRYASVTAEWLLESIAHVTLNGDTRYQLQTPSYREGQDKTAHCVVSTQENAFYISQKHFTGKVQTIRENVPLTHLTSLVSREPKSLLPLRTSPENPHIYFAPDSLYYPSSIEFTLRSDNGDGIDLKNFEQHIGNSERDIVIIFRTQSNSRVALVGPVPKEWASHYQYWSVSCEVEVYEEDGNEPW